jgi:tRNA (cytidine/uridine-2'-O-)-methyltransferase
MLSPTLHVVLYQPEIPANAGAIGRTCLALGAKLWMVRPLGFRTGDRHLRRAGLDYWQHLDWEVADDWPDLLRRLPDSSREPWFLSKSAGRPYVEAHFALGDALVFGPETQGLPPSLRDAYPGRSLSIPMRPPARSLNLSVSVGIVAYEAWRQCRGDWENAGAIEPSPEG